MKNQKESETVIPVKDIETALESVRDVRANMTFLSALTPKERKTLPRMTSGLLGLMEEAVQPPGKIRVFSRPACRWRSTTTRFRRAAG